MEIIINKGVDQKKVGLIHSAVDFYSKLLIHGNSRRAMKITITELEYKSKKEGLLGSAEWDFDYIRPRDFIIRIYSRRSKKTVVQTIAHEMMHVKQFVRGDLKHRFDPKQKIFWKDAEIDTDMVQYEQHPWEIEAYSYEDILVEEFEKYHDYF